MILGAILAGGRSSRFGSDKAKAALDGVALIDHVRSRLETVAPRMVVCGGSATGLETIADRPAPDLGPLGGLAAALCHAAEAGFDRVITVPCDTPILSDKLLASLAGAQGDMFLDGLPVIGSWQACNADRLVRHLLDSGNRSMKHWTTLIGATAIALPSPPNINHRGDLDALAAGRRKDSGAD